MLCLLDFAGARNGCSLSFIVLSLRHPQTWRKSGAKRGAAEKYQNCGPQIVHCGARFACASGGVRSKWPLTLKLRCGVGTAHQHEPSTCGGWVTSHRSHQSMLCLVA